MAAEELLQKKKKIVTIRKELKVHLGQRQNQWEHLVTKQKKLFDETVNVKDKDAGIVKPQL